MKDTDPKEAYTKAAAYCSRTERCPQDVARQLDKWGIRPAEQACIIDRLTEERFIDEERFCRCFVRDKFRYARWGRIKITYALKTKKLPPAAIEKGLHEIEETEYVQTLQKLLQEKARSLDSGPAYERNGKLIRFALGRGFEMDFITRCLNVDDNEKD